MHRRCVNCKQKWQSETHQPRNARFSTRTAVIVRKKSFRGLLINSCRKMMDVLEREARNAQEMHKLQTKMAIGNSPAKKC